MTFDTLRLQIDDGIARITLRRQDNANAMNAILARELLDAGIACDVDPSVRAVLIDAEGRMFCAGGDLDTFRRALIGVDLETGDRTIVSDQDRGLGPPLNAPTAMSGDLDSPRDPTSGSRIAVAKMHR